MIFNERVHHGLHVMLADAIRGAVDAARAVSAVYREAGDSPGSLPSTLSVKSCRGQRRELTEILREPARRRLQNRAALDEALGRAARVAAATLRQRNDAHVRDEIPDDFNVEFKRRDVLQALRDRARDNYQLVWRRAWRPERAAGAWRATSPRVWAVVRPPPGRWSRYAAGDRCARRSYGLVSHQVMSPETGSLEAPDARVVFGSPPGPGRLRNGRT